MSKKRKAVTVMLGLFVALIIAGAAAFMNSIHAADDVYDLEVKSGYKPKAEVPLTIEVSKPEFYFNGNINPGDVLEADIIFTNTSEKDAIQVTISDIINLLGDDDLSIDFLNQLELTITVDGKVVYQGPHGQTTNPVIGWIQIPPGASITVHIAVQFPKDTDNTYQGAPVKVKYVFESRIDIPEDYDPPKPVPREKIKTGIDGEGNIGYAGMILLFGLLVIILYIIYLLIKRKKDKEKEKQEQEKEQDNSTEI